MEPRRDEKPVAALRALPGIKSWLEFSLALDLFETLLPELSRLLSASVTVSNSIQAGIREWESWGDPKRRLPRCVGSAEIRCGAYLVRAGKLTGFEPVPTQDARPGVPATRHNNRGMEGIAAEVDGILYAILRRPLNNPNSTAADANGNLRFVGIEMNRACRLAVAAPGPGNDYWGADGPPAESPSAGGVTWARGDLGIVSVPTLPEVCLLRWMMS